MIKNHDTVRIRKDFPFLKRTYEGLPLAYLDNASTTQKPQIVIEEISKVYKNHYANVHRGVYDLSEEATSQYEGVREKVKDFIGASGSREVIFTRNTTESINLLAYTLGQSLSDGDEILLSQMEHHSNIVPWQLAAERLKTNAKRDIKIKYILLNGDGTLDLKSIDKLLSKKTKILSLTLMSNVLGTKNDIRFIMGKAKKKCPSLVAICDAAQAAAHSRLDVKSLGCDFLAISAHKMYGPTGVGVLWGKEELLEKLPPFMGGGDMILSVDFEKTTFNELPWKFEAGTPNIADVIAFGRAIDFIEEIGFSRINKIEDDLTIYALKKLSADSAITVYGPGVSRQGPVISFNVDGVHPHDVASILSSVGVAIRSGHHCAQPLMKVLGINAACRVSFGIYNTKEEIDRFIEGISKVKKVFGLK